MTKSILPVLLLLCSCGTVDTVNVGNPEAQETKEIESVDDSEQAYQDEQDRQKEIDDLNSQEIEPEAETSQPQWSSDKLYKGMSKELVLELLGTPESIDAGWRVTWNYAVSNAFCVKEYYGCAVYFDSKGGLSDFYEIDGEWIHVTSF